MRVSHNPAMIACVVSVLFAIATYFLYIEVERQEHNLIQRAVKDVDILLAHAVEDNTNSELIALRRMAQRWEVHGGTEQREWREDAKHYLEDSRGLREVLWVGSDFRVRWVEAAFSDHSQPGMNIITSDEKEALLRRAMRRHTVTLAPPFEIASNHHRAYNAYIPLYIDDGKTFDGFIVGVHDVDVAFSSMFYEDSADHFNVIITDGDREIYSHNSDDMKHKQEFGIVNVLHIFNRTWRFSIWPNESFITAEESAFPLLVLFCGLMISVLLGVVVYTIIIVRRKSQDIGQKSVELAESQQRLSNVIAHAVDGLIVIDDHGIVESFNPACETIFGYDASEVIGNNIKMLMPEPYHTEHDVYLEHYRDTNDAKIIGIGRTVKGRRKNGDVFALELAVSELEFAHRRVFSGIVRDVSEREEHLSDIEENNAYLQLAEDMAGLGHWRVNLVDGNIYWSDVVYDIHGKDKNFTPSLEEAVDFYHPDDRDFVNACVEKAMINNEGFEFEKRIIRADGEERIVRSKGTCQTDKRGVVTAVFGTFQDITEAVKASEELTESQSFLELMKENNPDVIFVKDREFRIVEANSTFINLYPEDKRDKIIGYTTLEDYKPQERDEFLAEDKKAFAEGYAATTETIHFPDGKVRTLYTQKIRFENAKGDPFILGIGRDVTEREELIEKLSESNEELERFAYICSHDMQEPLRMIQAFSEKLDKKLSGRDVLEDKEKHYLQMVTDGAVRAQELVKDVLAYARLDKESVIEQVDLAEVMERVQENLASVIEQTGAVIHVDDTLPILNSNRTQLYQLLLNLTSNALKFQKKGVTPEVSVSSESTGDEEWTIAVKDNGIGIKKDYQDKVFQIFQRLHHRGDYAGTGIGLAICQKVAERHGGKVWFESEEGKGTTFLVSLKSVVPSAKNQDAA